MRSALILGTLLAVAMASVPSTNATYCEAWPYEVDCSAAVGDIALAAHRVDHVDYLIRADACLAQPGTMVVAWWVSLADHLPGSLVVASTPTGDPSCAHRAFAQPVVRFGTFSPSITCGQVVAATPESAGSRLVCDE